MTDIPNQTKWVKVFQDLATDLKAEVALAAASEIIAKQSTAADLKALVTLAGLQGIIPNPITATRIDKWNYSTNIQTVIVYTVPANKKLYIASSWLSVYSTAAGLKGFSLSVRDTSDVLKYYILSTPLNTAVSINITLSHCPALEASAGDDVVVASSTDASGAEGGFHGWLEDV